MLVHCMALDTWHSLHAGLLCMLFAECTFFQISVFKNPFRNTTRVSNSLDPNQARVDVRPDLVQTICKGCHHRTLASKGGLITCIQLSSDFVFINLAHFKNKNKNVSILSKTLGNPLQYLALVEPSILIVFGFFFFFFWGGGGVGGGMANYAL